MNRKMNGIILYKSKYGASKKYAEWIAERTGFVCIKTDEADVKKLAEYDTIILGGGVYATSIAGLSFLKKNISKLAGKRIIVFCCGASPYDQKTFDAGMQRIFKGDLEGIPCYYCRGTFALQEMSFKDRMLCKLLRKAVAKKNPEDYEPWEKGLMEVSDDEKGDWTDISYIEPIITELNKPR